MRKSEELHHKDVRARRTFTRLVREKDRILDLLFEMNEFGHLRPDLKVLIDEPLDIEHKDRKELSQFASHYFSLIDEVTELSSDDEQQKLSTNSMDVQEWIYEHVDEEYLHYLQNLMTGTSYARNKKRKETDRYRNSDTEDEQPRKRRAV